MIVWCGSHRVWYVPFFNFTVQLLVPVPATLVFLLTPEPAGDQSHWTLLG
jgi:hypothetical protein